VAPADWTGFTILQMVETALGALDWTVTEALSGVRRAMTVQTVTEYSCDTPQIPRTRDG
jgi:hypothetical protein